MGKGGCLFGSRDDTSTHHVLWSHTLPITQLNGCTRKGMDERQKNNTGSQKKKDKITSWRQSSSILYRLHALQPWHHLLSA